MRTIQGLPELRTLVGTKLGTSDWLTISQERIDAFAAATGDDQWIHTDPVRAATESPYKTTVAHGFLTLSLCIQLSQTSFHVADCRMIVNYGLNRVRFPSPVKSGARVRMHSELLDIRDAAEGVQATFKHTIEAEGEPRPACVAESVLRLFF
ncbi:MAG: MaoC family dehydratase [Planctomycetaceae bacterium]|nr:MaoC family dehydratase [Planctomycetaceae bacterium]